MQDSKSALTKKGDLYGLNVVLIVAESASFRQAARRSRLPQSALASVTAGHRNDGERRKGKSDALLTGRVFDDRGNAMSPSHTLKKGVRYRYYVSTAIVQGRKADAGSPAHVPAADTKRTVAA